MSTVPDTRIQAITGRSSCHEARDVPREHTSHLKKCLTVPCGDAAFLAVADLADSLLARHPDASWATERELRRDGSSVPESVTTCKVVRPRSRVY